MFKRFLSALVFSCAIGLFADNGAMPTRGVPLYKKIAQENLKTLVQQGVASDTSTLNALVNDEKTLAEVMEEKVKQQLNPDSYAKRQAIFSLLNRYEEQHPLPISDVLEDGTWKDLEMLCGPKTAPELYVAAKIDRTVTEVGRATLYRKLIQPTGNFEELKNQQTIVRKLVEDEALFQDLEVNLRKLAIPENSLLSFWGEDILSSMIKDDKFFLPFEERASFIKKASDWLNKNEYMVQAADLVELTMFAFSLSVLAGTAATFTGGKLGLIDEKHFNQLSTQINDKPGFDSLLGMFIRPIDYFFPSLEKDNPYKYKQVLKSIAFIFSCWSSLRIYRKVRKEMLGSKVLAQGKLIHLAAYIDSLHTMIRSVQKHSELCSLMPQISTLTNKIDELRKRHHDFDHLLNMLSTNTFKGKSSFFSHWGRIDVVYRLMEQEKEKFNEIMVVIGELDAQMSIARLYKEMKNKRVECCFPVYQEIGQPHVSIKDFWHPCLDSNKVVANSIEIDGKNIVITGPNAAGKSTIMKGLVLSLIMAQSLGIATAKELTFTPFSKIITYLNITDDIAAGNSHFKAGVMRARDVINEMNKVRDNEVGFAVVDELFNGTTFKEGQAAAYSFIKLLGKKKNNMIVTTTHFPMMANLAKIDDHFLNYKVYVLYDEHGKIKYPYKLEPGVSDQVVTIKILKEEGFGDAFIDDAEQILTNS